METQEQKPGLLSRAINYALRRARQILRILRQSAAKEAAARAAVHAASAERAAETAARHAVALREAAAAQRLATAAAREAAAAQRASIREAEAIRRAEAERAAADRAAAAQAAAAAERAAAVERAAALAREAAAARLAAIRSDEDDEILAHSALVERMRLLSALVASEAAEVAVCNPDHLRVMRRADLDEKSLADFPDIRGLAVGEGIALSRGTSLDRSEGQNFLVLAPNVRLSRVAIVVRGDGNLIYVGPNTRLSNVTLKVVGENNTIAVGQDVTMESGSVLCERASQSLLISDDCMISNGVIIRTSDHHGIFVRGSGERLNPPESVVIGAHVWLGNGCRVNKGTRIGPGTVVGQLSIAGGVLEGNCIYAGVPARKLREGIVWSRTDGLEGVPLPFR